jgi:hypothetical protein
MQPPGPRHKLLEATQDASEQPYGTPLVCYKKLTCCNYYFFFVFVTNAPTPSLFPSNTIFVHLLFVLMHQQPKPAIQFQTEVNYNQLPKLSIFS